ncbi:hypothetical protein [Yinghuangia seranimata]|uniref:hypothetical protein n=1 Tax=Yinghuangia seranimata TaxID=408067 RepID=UPI00248AC58D|nr:hypothetical protein [Yinghuangia seranimata]MDI2128265.1 hypothetical protein [Yinghuangia seranimata]
MTVGQQRRGGVRDRVRARRVREGVWRRVAPNVVLVGAGPVTRRQRVLAAVLHAEHGALATGLTALELGEVRNVPYRPEIHLLVGRAHRGRGLPGVVYERTRRLPPPQALRVPPTAPYPRAVLDACRRLASAEQARAVALAAVQARVCDVAALAVEAAHVPPGDRARVAAIIDELASGVRSLPEAELRRHVLAAGLPEPLWNPRVHLPDGTFLCSPDALWPHLGVAAEVDSVAYHYATAAARADTAARAARMRAAGLVVVSFLPGRIRDDPSGVVRVLRDALAVGATREVPVLTVHAARP